MYSLLAALLLAAAPSTPAQKAKDLSGQKAWEELYLAFGSGDEKAVPEEQRATVSGALAKGCQAMLKDDAVMAYSMGERAIVYEESAPALRCLATAARKTEQRAAAEAALLKGVTRFPKDGSFPLELGKLLLEEQDSVGAQAALEKVPPRSREAAEAKRLLKQARQQTLQEDAARSEATRISRRLGGGAPQAVSRGGDETSVVSLGTRPGMSVRAPDVGFESRVDASGMRVRANNRFVISYFDNQRDFSQRADYEGKVVDILNDAYHFTRQVLGETRESPVAVVLYTAKEFGATFGQRAARFIAGKYTENAIRINDAAELTRETRATLVHEYIHAAVSDFCGGNDQDMDKLPIWFNEGLAMFVEWKYLDVPGPNLRLANEMRAVLAASGKLPKLRDMTWVAPMNTASPHMGYAASGLAVKEMMRREGAHRLMTLLRAVCQQGSGFDEALKTHYGMTLEDLDTEVERSIEKR
ncbi:peptidase MA family metallohydrolase [Myxococcus stipitatus]|uniref:peptidase MA family metallohydrolase n=1 Tax=Myxococcus stipitatus TaxID=83455 RepID=UPI003144FEEA